MFATRKLAAVTVTLLIVTASCGADGQAVRDGSGRTDTEALTERPHGPRGGYCGNPEAERNRAFEGTGQRGWGGWTIEELIPAMSEDEIVRVKGRIPYRTVPDGALGTRRLQRQTGSEMHVLGVYADTPVAAELTTIRAALEACAVFSSIALHESSEWICAADRCEELSWQGGSSPVGVAETRDMTISDDTPGFPQPASITWFERLDDGQIVQYGLMGDMPVAELKEAAKLWMETEAR